MFDGERWAAQFEVDRIIASIPTAEHPGGRRLVIVEDPSLSEADSPVPEAIRRQQAGIPVLAPVKGLDFGIPAGGFFGSAA